MKNIIITLVIVLISTYIFLQKDALLNKYFVKNTSKINIGYTNEVLESIVYLADKKGFFKDNGLEVTFKNYSIGKEALEKGLLKNEVDIVSSAVAPAVTNYIDGKKIKIISLMGRADDQLKILARKSKNIKEIKDLKGKKIATVQGSAAHYFLYTVLENNQISTSDINMTFTEAENLPELISADKVDAISIKEPFFTQARELLGGDGVVFDQKK